MMHKLLQERWHRSGVEKGDLLLVHSDIKRTLLEFRRQGHNITPTDILQSFLDTLGAKGTLVLPLFNFDFPSRKRFDIKNTPSQMGALTEAGRRHKNAVRTGHPIYSCAVIGHLSQEFKEINNQSGYGKDSPFGRIYQLNGKIASLDLEDQHSMTFYHHVEEMKHVDYRYFKTFTGLYTAWDGITHKKSYDIFVRNREVGVKTDVNPAGELLWKAGLYKGYKPKVDTGLRTINARDMFHYVETLIIEGKALGTLYSIGDKE